MSNRTLAALAAVGAAGCVAAGPALAGVAFSDPVEHAVGAPANIWETVPSLAGSEGVTVVLTTSASESNGTPAELVLVHVTPERTAVTERVALPEGELANLTLADLDGDGAPEMLLSRRGETVISVFRRVGGTLQQGPDISIGSEPQGAAVGDLNGDGQRDLVVLAQGTDFFSGYLRLLADGSGGFGPPHLVTTESEVQVSILSSVGLRDDDGDGDLDLVATGAIVP